MLLNAMVLTLLFPARINGLHRTRLTFAIRQKPNTRMGNHVSQNRNMYSNQSQFSQRPERLKDLPLKHKQRAPLQVISKASRASTVARALSRAVRENVAGTILTTPRVASSDRNEEASALHSRS